MIVIIGEMFFKFSSAALLLEHVPMV